MKTPATTILRAVPGWFALLLFLSVLMPARAQERWLLAFDTSAAMKKRLPALEVEIKKFCALNANQKLHSGDSVGVWTFDQAVHAGQFPLMNWDAGMAMVTATNLIKFINKQHFTGETSFGALQPTLGHVIQGSERLTIVIFCDGEGEINWTPYDEGINDALRQSAAERKKTRRPVVLILRTQRGKFIGSTVNFPPALPNIPPFPPLPTTQLTVTTTAGDVAAVQVETKPAAAPVPPPVPPLIIVGTSEGTDTNATAKFLEAKIASAAALAATNAAKTNALETNAVSAPPMAAVTLKTNLVITPMHTGPAASIAPADTTTTTNAVAGTTEENTDNGAKFLVWVSAGLFGLAMVLVIFLVRYQRRPQTSLITSLMSDDPNHRK